MFKPNLIIMVVFYFALFGHYSQKSYASSDFQPTNLSVYDLEKITSTLQLKPADVDQLYQSFEQHFGRFVRAKNSEKVDFHFLFESQSSFKSFNLMYRLRKAMSQGYDVSRFEKFGFNIESSSSYTLDYGTHPHLASIDSLFHLVHISRDGKEHFLIPLGFRPEDIDIIENYVAETDTNRLFNDEYFPYLEYILPIIRTTLRSEKIVEQAEITKQINAFNYTSSYIRYRQDRNWAIGLMRSLDKQRQRILQQVLIKVLNGSTTGGASSQQRSHKNTAEFLLSDTVDYQIEVYKSQQNYRRDASKVGMQ